LTHQNNCRGGCVIEVILAKTAGFCYGVANAVNTVYDLCAALKQDGAPLVTFGPLIHNRVVTDELAAMGVHAIKSLSEVTNETVVIRSHGVSPAVTDELTRRGIKYVDCTCPFVKRIHKIVSAANCQVIVLGDEEHPEIQGIIGYARDVHVLKNMDEVRAYPFDLNAPYILVSQTTYSVEDFERARDYINQLGANVTIVNTICKATAERQEEAETLAKQCDAMVVLGDPNSSNTKKLYNICKKHCELSYLVERIQNIVLNILRLNGKMGITAGASTPPAITEEAVRYMSEFEQNNNQSFADMLNESNLSLHTGQVVKGRVITVTPNEVTVNLNYKYEGVIARNEITDDPAADLDDLLKPGQEIDVFVIHVNDADGNVQLSKKKLDSQKKLVELEEAFTSKTPVPGKIIEQVKGGLIALIKGVRVFVPSSQISNRFAEDLSVYLGKTLNFNILEFDRSRPRVRVVAGRRELASVEHAQKRDEFFATAEIGQRITGTVSRIASFGAFVDLGGVDGLIHISELSWGRVKNVSDVLSEGDTVSVTVRDLDPEKGKISLTLRNVETNPWNAAADKYPIGSVVTGKVVRIVTFGAFVELEPGLDGMVHISQISPNRIAKVEDELAVGDVISVKVIDVNIDNKKISLSKKEADGAEAIDQPDLDESIEQDEPIEQEQEEFEQE
jgi:4-hydroxy-3-methylbut-2-enyl diphosphate reductase